MNIFDLRKKLIQDYSSFLKSYLKISDDRIRNFVESELNKGILWPDSILQLNPSYEYGSTIQELCNKKILNEKCSEFFGAELKLYKHQEESINSALKKENYILTTGTGSGKSLTYLIPIVDYIFKNNPVERKVRAIIVYPMNALINSQYQSLEYFSANKNLNIFFEKYTGQEKDELRKVIRENPPHIILTNYVMLEYMLLRPKESIFVDALLSDIKFLVLDELHTYRGRQGSDIAYLIRRLKERSGNRNLICIGTSATMSAENSREKKKETVAKIASKLFGSRFNSKNVIDETLSRKTASSKITKEELNEAIKSYISKDILSSDFIHNPLAIWLEEYFGIKAINGFYYRQKPRTLKDGILKLSEITGYKIDKCENVLKQFLEIGSKLKAPDNNSIFPLKIHQFISQGGAVYSTIQKTNERHLTLDGQVYIENKSGKSLLYPVYFCRECGQEYYLADYQNENKQFIPRSPFYTNEEEYLNPGYLLVNDRNIWDESLNDNLPENWFTQNGKNFNKNFSDFVPKEYYVDSLGFINLDRSKTVKTWFLKSPFLTCLRCGIAFTKHSKNDFKKLSRLSSEGRSSATTVLSLSALSNMNNIEDISEKARKILSFTDNRQDASLQSGHFNDFIQVSILRAAIYNALLSNNNLDYLNIAKETNKYLNLPFADYSTNPLVDNDKKFYYENTLTDIIEYRIYEDLRRGWRVNQPNLEQCGLLKIEYKGLKNYCEDDSKWISSELLLKCSSEKREFIITTFLDHLRKNLAIDCEKLDERNQQLLKKRAREYINDKWGFDEKDILKTNTRFLLPEFAIKDKFKDLSLSERSGIGRFIRSTKVWDFREEKLSNSEYINFISIFIKLLIKFDFVILKNDNARDFIQLRNSSILWRIGDGNPPQADPIRTNYFETRFSDSIMRETNVYFRDLYSKVASGLKLLVAKEHTGQIANYKREEIEIRFKNADISTLFCSPTMELGIDISDLNVVHLRNIPPNPANYAQRSGRAGRSGQPSLIISYSGFGNSHDQYFFKRPDKMVSGIVEPQKFDIANEELVRSHLHSIWLAKSGIDLGKSILDVLDVKNSTDNYPIYESLKSNLERLAISENIKSECLLSFAKVIEDNLVELKETNWYNDDWLESVLINAYENFNLSFNRWREMYKFAIKQRNEARDKIDNARIYRLDISAKLTAERQEAEAKQQIELLFGQSAGNQESDFYPYRYLASESFIPGYSFPKLPIRAYIPNKIGEGEFISRARFLALIEYGPRNIIYHEGKKYRVIKSSLPSGSATDRYIKANICLECGYIHKGTEENSPRCINCGKELNSSTSQFISKLFKMNDVSTMSVERITSDEEDRLRQGYETSTHFCFPTNQNSSKKSIANITSENGETLISLTHVSSTQIYKINHGFKKNKGNGFSIDTSNGMWSKQDDMDTEESTDEHSRNIDSNVKIFVSDTKNALIVKPEIKELQSENILASFESALLSGIQEYFQVEEKEIASERIGRGSNRRILIYEASEGGLGILNRIVEEPKAICNIAKIALDIMHYEIGESDVLIDMKKECISACYECLLSYSNQRDHRNLDRHNIANIFLKITKGVTLKGSPTRNYDKHYLYLKSITDTRSELERIFLKHLHKTRRKLPDEAQKELKDYYTIPDFYYNENKVCVYCNGSVHDSPEQRKKDEKIYKDLKEIGYRVVVIYYKDDMENQIKQHPGVFGESNV